MSEQFKFFLHFFILSVLSVYGNSIMIMLKENQEVCFRKELKASDTIKVNYIVSGEIESTTHSRLNGPNSTTLYYYRYKNNAHFESYLHIGGKI